MTNIAELKDTRDKVAAGLLVGVPYDDSGPVMITAHVDGYVVARRPKNMPGLPKIAGSP